jgi:hypothetical protein
LILFAKSLAGSELKLDIPDTVKGTYFQTVNDGQKYSSQKLLKLH